nr:hypothetical protein [uncultured Pedobacter sp.]
MERINIEPQEKLEIQKSGKTFKQHDYYFHPDEDFKEDRDWGKQKTVVSKTISKRTSQLEI